MTEFDRQTVLDRWLHVLESEYLDEFIRSGGAAVKFVSGGDEILTRALSSICQTSKDKGYYYSLLDPSKLNDKGKAASLHRIDHVFFEITEDFDWRLWAREQALLYLSNAGINVPPGCDIGNIDQVASHNGRDVQDLLNQYQREFATPQLRDPRLSIEFRAAITALGRAQLIPDSMTPTTEHVMLEWFHGRAVAGGSSALKNVQVFERINIANARNMLTSFCHWLPNTNHAGLVVVLDFRPYEYKRLPLGKRQAEQNRMFREAILSGKSSSELTALVTEYDRKEPDVAYSDAAYTQMLTLLRRFIDEVDALENMMLIVLTSPEFYKDKAQDASVMRCYFDYDALQTRIGQEVHDISRANLAASLVHLGAEKCIQM